MSDYFRQFAVKSFFLSAESWVILSDIEQSIKTKIEAIGTPLKDWEIRINYGIKTGYNEAFIIDGKKKEELIDADPKSAEIIRPILRGRDIRKYGFDFEDLWLINIHNGYRDYDGNQIDMVVIDQYPAVKKHLNSYWTEIEKRYDKGNTPYNLRNCAYMEDFYKQKIVWGNLNLKASYCIAPEGYFINAPSSFITPVSNYLLAILNSKLADYYIRSLGVTRNGGYFEYKPMFVELLPVPFAQNEIEILFNNLMKNKISVEIEEKIDRIIYNIYNLTEEEIGFIESQ
ncbi:TaqI-like C-terminal specificity domain-containing protein [Chryseobacterium sp. AG363]|uniref:TaqI-like C-terminal specificity domain-containing protein n=1 Tax=Chryseobacterium sp. AG363 TaxID=2183997 RepID=UPI000E724DB4|nr:TaqI-like C-terminal specificity domain-containing protein [Chryseobacterium sp. AG363]RKE82491.1 TaqI restriction endonuclease [Chryseobacterium sp. AG363]